MKTCFVLHITPGCVSNVVQCSYRQVCVQKLLYCPASNCSHHHWCVAFVEVFLFCYLVLERDSSVCCTATQVDICSSRGRHWCIQGVIGAVSLGFSMLNRVTYTQMAPCSEPRMPNALTIISVQCLAVFNIELWFLISFSSVHFFPVPCLNVWRLQVVWWKNRMCKSIRLC